MFAKFAIQSTKQRVGQSNMSTKNSKIWEMNMRNALPC